jgi:hypothetical protein
MFGEANIKMKKHKKGTQTPRVKPQGFILNFTIIFIAFILKVRFNFNIGYRCSNSSRYIRG